MDLLSGNQAMQTLENEVPGTTRGLTSGPAVPLREFNLLRWFLVVGILFCRCCIRTLSVPA